jgi:hypothetical protein
VSASSGVPPELLAGPCIEVWGGPDRDAIVAFRRYREAREAWLAARGISHWDSEDRVPEPLRGYRDAPWSFDYLEAERPDRLRQTLTGCGLPTSWRPTAHHDPPDYGPGLVPPEARTHDGWRQWRARKP